MVFSDIHGCYFEFEKVLSYFQKENKRYIFLGDYIDRGSYSKEVVEKVLELSPKVCLLGNHEDMMLRYLKFGHKSWLFPTNGGNSTIESFGGVENINTYLSFFEQLRFLHVEEFFGVKFLFSHANVLPDFPIEKATNYEGSYSEFLNDIGMDLSISNIWLREVYPLKGYVLIHGHTPTFNKKVGLYKVNDRIVDINIDTGCVYGGNLTALCFPENEKELSVCGGILVVNDKLETEVIGFESF